MGCGSVPDAGETVERFHLTLPQSVTPQKGRKGSFRLGPAQQALGEPLAVILPWSPVSSQKCQS